MDTNPRSDVVVVGGGLIGCSIALEAAREGLRVTLLEARRVAGGASRAAAGMLSPLGEATEPGPFLELALSSLGLYPDFVARIREASGIDPAFLRSGRVELATTPRELDALRTRLPWILPHDPQAQVLEARSLQSLIPGIGQTLAGGMHLPGDHQVDSRLLTVAAARAAVRAGVHVLEGTPVTGVTRTGRRCTGVLSGDDRWFPSSRVVLAAGAWGGMLPGLPTPLPILPIRGQMAAVGPLRTPPTRILHGEGVYLVPRRSGRILIGASAESVGFRPHVTPQVIARLMESARILLPGLVGIPVTDVWAGLRPGTPDGLPILGADPGLEGLIHAAGHFRNGILLAPVTARITTDLLTGRSPVFDLRPFAPGRFTTGSTTGGGTPAALER